MEKLRKLPIEQGTAELVTQDTTMGYRLADGKHEGKGSKSRGEHHGQNSQDPGRILYIRDTGINGEAETEHINEVELRDSWITVGQGLYFILFASRGNLGRLYIFGHAISQPKKDEGVG